jgi:hypothetical protein
MLIERAFTGDIVTNTGTEVFSDRPITDARIRSRLHRQIETREIFLNVQVSEFKGGAQKPAMKHASSII